jgi:hypothetical protein
MKRSLIVLTLLSLALGTVSAAPPPDREYILLIGGPSLRQWEKYKTQPHDHWWANFVRAGRIRTEQLREKWGPDAKITWLVYEKGYRDRARQENQDLIGLIGTVRDKYNLNLIWFDKGDEVINYMNNGQPRDRVKVAFFEFFGHSNKACFMFDYSSAVDSASKSFLHENELVKINRKIFTRDANIRSWGCHTGESFSKKWYKALGNRMWGVIGKTQYMMNELPILSSKNGKWVN